MKPRDVIVIGAGQAGLAIAWQLTQRHLDVEILEAGPAIGHSWRSRWDSLRLFTPAEYDSLPGMPFPAPAGTYPGKDDVADYLAAYAAAFRLPVRSGTPVTQLTRGGGLYQAHTPAGTFLARQVVVATGPFQRPQVPVLSADLSDDVLQLHSSLYRSPRQLPPGRVLVVGGGNSGVQIAAELAASRQVILAVGGRPQMVPQRLAGRDLFWWLTNLGLLRKPAGSRVARRIRARGELVIGSSWRQLRTAGVDLRPRVVSAISRRVRFADGTTATADAVVWATGYRTDHSWIDVPGAVADGTITHTRGITPADGLYVLGMPWQHTRGSALLGFVNDDATWLADRIAIRASQLATPRVSRSAA